MPPAPIRSSTWYWSIVRPTKLSLSLCVIISAATSRPGRLIKLAGSSRCASSSSTFRRISSCGQAFARNWARRAGSSSTEAWYSLSISFHCSAFNICIYSLTFPAHLGKEKRFCKIPFPLDCPRRDLQRLSRFFFAQTAEKTEFYNLCLARIDCAQLLKRPIQINNLGSTITGNRRSFLQGHDPHSRAPFDVFPSPRKIDQNSPHQLGTYGKKLRAINPMDVFPVDQPQVRFIDQCRRLKSVIRTLLPHLALSQPMQFFVEE